MKDEVKNEIEELEIKYQDAVKSCQDAYELYDDWRCTGDAYIKYSEAYDARDAAWNAYIEAKNAAELNDG